MPKGEVKRDVLLRMLRFVWQHFRWQLLVVLACVAVSSLTSLVSSLFTRTLIDDYIVPLTQAANPEYASLAQTLFKLALVLFLGTACSYAYNRLMINISQGTMLRLRKSLFERMEHLPLSYFDTRSHGDMMSVYTNDVDSLRQMISTSLAQVFSSVITIVATFTSMVVLSVPLTLVSMVMAVVMVFTTSRLGSISRSHFRTQQQSLARVNGFIEEMMTGQKVVKVFCHEQQAISDFETINEQLRASAYNANKTASMVMPINANLGNVGFVLIAVAGALLAVSDATVGGYALTVSLGTIVAFLQLHKGFTRPVTQVSQQINSVLNASVGAERVFALMDATPEVDEGHWDISEGHWFDSRYEVRGTSCEVRGTRYENTHTAETTAESSEVTHLAPRTSYPAARIKIEGDVDFRHVDFGYTPERQILFDIDINTSPSQKIAFVGGTGAGKTTVINLINRFYDVQQGEVYYDNIPVRDIKKSALRKSMSIVLQETHLFTGTVLDNIRYGRLDATDEECREAARQVGADEFIRRLPDGYNTMLHGDGGSLSQGERQLLAIVRAAVTNPPVLILDEATSSIDTHTERLVQRGMDSLMQGRTTFVIAHRLSTIRNADQIIVLEHGHIIEHGTHEELLSLHGRYYQLYTGNSAA